MRICNTDKERRLLHKGVFFLMLFFMSHVTLAQTGNAESNKPVQRFSFSVGFNFQSFTLSKVTHGIYKDVVLGASSVNATGVGLSTGVNFSLSSRFMFRYAPTWRYDVIEARSYFGWPVPKDKYGFFSDHHFSIVRSFTVKGVSFIKQPVYIGVGYSIISLGQSWKQYWQITYAGPPPYSRTGSGISFQFEGYHFFIDIPVYKNFYIEPKLLYVPKGQIVYEAYQRAYMFHLLLAYSFKKNTRNK